MTAVAESISNGNMTGWGNTAYTWDELGRLVAINGTSLDASYKYDALGRRIEKTINNTTTKYLYDGADIVLETDGNDVATAYYIRTLNIDEPLARIELDSGGNVTGIRFYLADALGSIIALTDENGDIKTRYNYTPFGEPEVSGDTSANPFMFTGREWDGATGLYYYRERYQSPILGRFISEDPIRFEGRDVNFYAYVKNSPLNYTDPFGESFIGGAICTIATAAFNCGLAGYSIHELNKEITRINEMIMAKEDEMESCNNQLRRADIMRDIAELDKLRKELIAEKMAIGASGGWTTALTTGACLAVWAIPSP